jgi:hypothetical protein
MPMTVSASQRRPAPAALESANRTVALAGYPGCGQGSAA